MIYNKIEQYITYLQKNPIKGEIKAIFDPVRGIEGLVVNDEEIGFYLFGKELQAEKIDLEKFNREHRKCEVKELTDSGRFVVYIICQKHQQYTTRQYGRRDN